MPELSQLVRQRLASGEAPGVHPDADILTAYAEQLLPGPERKQVLEHIAACSHCREVMVLSLPEPVAGDAAREAAPAAPQRRWRWRPALGLAASVAAMAVVTTVIIELPQKPVTFESRESKRQAAQTAPVTSADNKTPASVPTPAPPESAAVNAPPPAPSINSAVGSSGPSSGVSARRETASHSASIERADVRLPAGRAVAAAKAPERDYVNKQMFVADQASADTAVSGAGEVPAAPMPRPAANQFPSSLLSNTTPPPAFADLPPQTQNSKLLRSRQPSSSSPSHFGILLGLPALGHKAEALLPKRSVAIAPGSLTFSAMGGKGQLNPAKPGDQVEVTAAAPTVEKAEAADLDRSSAFTERALSTSGGAFKMEKAAGVPPVWKVADGKLLKSSDSAAWVEGFASGEGIEFSVVSAHGANVWAGGANASLVHSSDGGASWERVTLGASATGTIVSISASGLNVHVKSSSGQGWSSQDGGKTWTLDN